ncbi:reverse transcriptase-like protein [Janibacter cremeus]|uniref:Putative phosphoglycerate mutase n=1 Tax=Janibacter cremeus TaxID=1285192 RepID=A0A852VR98_9MICO|nr:reverse transcriptase-like protein [Janibacter cremeus]NYF99472.1 putative phosphoglycerate mutase [Janibacter cremeus]
MGRSLRVEADGGSRGNPGVAGYGALVRDVETDELLVELAAPLGRASNNVAEYRGMLEGLQAARSIDPGADVEVAMDSKLVVEQMSGRWKIKHPDMRALALRGRDLVAEICAAGGSVEFTWLPREANTAADALSNRGMDGEDVQDWHAEQVPQPPHPGRGEPTRVVLVRHGATEQAKRAGVRVAALVGDADVRVLTCDLARARQTGGILAERLEVEPQADAGWGERSQEETHDHMATRVIAAWERAVAGGGTVVIACPRVPILLVLAHVLGMPHERMGRLASAPGSLTAIEAWPDGEAVVAFTNRT